ncbi:MAG: MFS transporter [Gemmatimonadales bacterium]
MSAPMPVGTPHREASGLDRTLRLISDVHPGEGTSALLLALNVFLLLTAYYVIKPLREALLLSTNSAETKSYLAAGQAILLLVLVPAYGLLADRLPRRRLITAVTGFFVLCLVAFYGLTRAAVPVGIPFFLWAGIFNMMIVAQFWGFANDLYTREQGERLFPIIAFGASLGAVTGSAVTGRLIPLLGISELLLVAAGILILALLLGNLVDARERARCEAGLPARFTTAEIPAATGEYLVQGKADAEKLTVSMSGAKGRPGTFRLVFAERYLLLIALLVLVVNWVNSTGEYVLSHTVARAAADAVAAGTADGLSASQYIGRFYANFFFGVNATALLLQLCVVSRLLRHFGVRTAILVMPLIAVIGYALLAFLPILAVVRWVKTAENATDYSLQNTVRNVLFLPTTREQKYKAKQAIDSFFVRSGDVLSALTIYVGTTMLTFGPNQFAMVNLALAGIWVVLALWIGRAYMRKTGASA